MFTACAGSAPTSAQPTRTDDPLLVDHGLAGLDAREIIERLDTMPMAERPTDLIASIEPNELILTDDQQRRTVLPMPRDEFYVSFAPYVNQTHACHFHSLTTCTGELRNAGIRVKVTDDGTGDVILDESKRTHDNGFLGVWLPRDIDATLTVDHEGLTGTSPITTKGDQAATCVTTLRLV
jgi:hypothetical protein